MEHLCFNSRPHEEVDTKQSTARGRNCVSTHDLTKRSTFTIPSKGLLIACFNSRPHEEVDLGRNWNEIWENCFNSRPHEEVDDSNMRGKQGALNVSTHDLTKRSTVYQEAHKELKEFQLTTSRRGRHCWLCWRKLLLVVSTHDLTKRSTSKRGTLLYLKEFQLTTSRRGRLQLTAKIFLLNSFQLTTSRRGRQSLIHI